VGVDVGGRGDAGVAEAPGDDGKVLKMDILRLWHAAGLDPA
jgi:hypothetical protein